MFLNWKVSLLIMLFRVISRSHSILSYLDLVRFCNWFLVLFSGTSPTAVKLRLYAQVCCKLLCKYVSTLNFNIVGIPFCED